MSNIWNDETSARRAPIIESFGAGGQAYIADIETGFMVSAEQSNPIFNFNATDNSVTNAEFLTNMTEARKIGSTMDFKATQIGFRVVKVSDGPASPAELAAMKKLLQSARVKINYGSNETIIGEFSGAHLMAPVDNVSTDTTATSMSQAGAIGNTAWINLKVPVPMQANVNIGGSVRFTLAVPSALTSTPNTFAFKVILSGLKVVKS